MAETSTEISSLTDGKSVGVYRVFSRDLVVMSERPSLAKRIDCFCRCLRSPGVGELDIVRFAAFATPSEKTVICCPELSTVKVAPSTTEEWFAFRRLFNALLFMPDMEHEFLHGACAVKDERTVAIQGESESGKSSCLLALLEAGYSLACDDLIPFSPDATSISAFPTAVTAHPSTFMFYPCLESLKDDSCMCTVSEKTHWSVNPADIFPHIRAYTELTPSHFFFVERTHNKRSTARECSPDESLWRLQHAFLQVAPPRRAHGIRHAGKCFELTKRLVAGCKFFHLENANLPETIELLMREADS